MANKVIEIPPDSTPAQVAQYFEREYFAPSGTPIGYAGFYTDFPDNFKYLNLIRTFIAQNGNLFPEYDFGRGTILKVLDIGCARGFLVKRLQDYGFDAHGVDCSHYCQLTRVTNTIHLGNIAKTNFLDVTQFKKKEFDLAVNFDCLEHVPEKYLELALSNIQEIAKNALFCPTTSDSVSKDDVDVTHICLKPYEWWVELLKSKYTETKDYNVQLVDRREIDKNFHHEIHWTGKNVGVQVGSFINMFYNTEDTVWYNQDVIQSDQQNLAGYARMYGFNFINQDATVCLPFVSESVNFLYSTHTFEHFNPQQAQKFLEEAKRVLKPGGLLRIGIPDVKKLAELLHSGKINELKALNSDYEQAQSDVDLFAKMVMDNHAALYDAGKLEQVLTAAGFVNAKESPPFTSSSAEMRKGIWDQYNGFTSYVEAQKSDSSK